MLWLFLRSAPSRKTRATSRFLKLKLNTCLNCLNCLKTYFFPIIYRAFFKPVPQSGTAAITVKEAPLFCVLPPVVTAAFSVALFFKYDVVMELIKGAF